MSMGTSYFLILSLVVTSAVLAEGRPLPEDEGWFKAVLEDTRASHDDHDHSEECGLVGHDLVQGFNELANEMSVGDQDDAICSHPDHLSLDTDIKGADMALTSNLTCGVMFDFISQLLVRLNLTTECCLENGTECGHHHHENRASVAEVYGYGFLMIFLVSTCPLIACVIVIPFLKKNSKFGKFYKYLYSLMIALGASALFCDAVLHLIPEAFGLHGHDNDHDDHGPEDKSFIWIACVIVGGMYFFFVFEVILHSCNSHKHSHGVDAVFEKSHSHQEDRTATSSVVPARGTQPRAQYGSTDQHNWRPQVSDDTDHLLEVSGENGVKTTPDECFEPTIPHGKCRDTRGGTPGIIHPGIEEEGQQEIQQTSSIPTGNVLVLYLRNVKPLAWLIIFGDAIHNFADGLALGAAISQSLSLGISTAIALMLHEIPHELGDFVILLSTGMRWYIALFFIVVSQVTAIIGFFVGVAVSSNNETANTWILAVAAGVFLYIALVDLLPGLIHTNEKGCTRLGLFIMTNIGFILAFAVLLLLALFEEELNSLISI